MKPRYSLKKSLAILLISVCITGGGVGSVLYLRSRTSSEGKIAIQSIIQTGPSYSPLPTAFLAQILNLSFDQPLSLRAFDVKKGCQCLLETHAIQKVVIKKVKPHTLYIDYTLRHPIAYLGDLSNTCLDAAGIAFPSTPFYGPRHLPYVYVGKGIPWGEQLETKYLQCLSDLFETLDPKEILEVDLADMEAPTLGRRQIVIKFKNQTILRLAPKNYKNRLDHYLILKKKLPLAGKVIDLRLPGVAYLAPI